MPIRYGTSRGWLGRSWQHVEVSKPRDEPRDGHRRPRPRPPLPEHQASEVNGAGMTHAQLVDALRGVDGLVDVTGGHDRPNFHLRHKPFLHFHVDAASGGVYADVKLGGGPTADFEPVWASTPAERVALLGRVLRHARRANRR